MLMTPDFKDALASLTFSAPETGETPARARLLAAAIKAFLTEGYHGVSTHDLASAADVQQSLIRYYFGTKIGLWQACVDTLFARYRADLAASIHAAHPQGQRALCEALIRHVASWPSLNTPLLRQSVNELSRKNPEIQPWVVNRHIKPVYRMVALILDEGKAAGIIRDIPTINLFYTLFLSASIANFSDEVAMLAQQEVRNPAFAQAHAQALCDMLLLDRGQA